VNLALPPAQVAQGRDPGILERIHDSRVEMAIWRRVPDPALAGWLDGLAVAHLPEARTLVDARDPGAAIAAILDRAAMPVGEERVRLADDIAALTRLFGSVSRQERVDLRLEPIAGDGCWKFHRDCVPLRLLATFRGAGTQWVRPAHAAAALDRQGRYDGPLEHLDRPDIALFKGSRAGPGRGIVHRSPPHVPDAGTVRLLLCLNLPPVD